MNVAILGNIGAREGLTVNKYGIIAEDDSDVDSLIQLIRMITGSASIGYAKFIGNGCGKIPRKARQWADILKAKGCNALILLHDLDRKTLDALRKDLESSLRPSPIKNHLICIPIEELESWLLSDSSIFGKFYTLKSAFPEVPNPESIVSPKEYIERKIDKLSHGKCEYLNAKHNEKLFGLIDHSKLTKCKSYIPLQEFLLSIT